MQKRREQVCSCKIYQLVVADLSPIIGRVRICSVGTDRSARTGACRQGRPASFRCVPTLALKKRLEHALWRGTVSVAQAPARENQGAGMKWGLVLVRVNKRQFGHVEAGLHSTRLIGCHIIGCLKQKNHGFRTR